MRKRLVIRAGAVYPRPVYYCTAMKVKLVLHRSALAALTVGVVVQVTIWYVQLRPRPPPPQVVDRVSSYKLNTSSPVTTFESLQLQDDWSNATTKEMTRLHPGQSWKDWVGLFNIHCAGYAGEKPYQYCQSSPLETLEKPYDPSRNTFLYMFTSSSYMYLLELSLCSLRKYHPDAQVTALLAREYFDPELFPEIVRHLREDLGVRVLDVPKLEFKNYMYGHKFEKNWLKLRLWQLEQLFDGIIVVDSDVVFGANVEHLFKLPFNFAYVRDMDKGSCQYQSLQGGVHFIRPCQAIFAQMRAMLESNKKLQFSADHAEQSFLNWYFKYDGAILPASYNVIDAALKTRLSGKLRFPMFDHRPDPTSLRHREGYPQLMHMVTKRWSKDYIDPDDPISYLFEGCVH